MCHNTHDDPVLRLALPGEVVVDMEEVYLEELLCDPVPCRSSIPYSIHDLCYSASASGSPAAELGSVVHEKGAREEGNAVSPCSEHHNLQNDTMKSDFVDVRSITSGTQAFSMLCDGSLSLKKYEEWAVHFFRWPTAPYCDFRRYTKCVEFEESAQKTTSHKDSVTPCYKKRPFKKNAPQRVPRGCRGTH